MKLTRGSRQLIRFSILGYCHRATVHYLHGVRFREIFHQHPHPFARLTLQWPFRRRSWHKISPFKNFSKATYSGSHLDKVQASCPGLCVPNLFSVEVYLMRSRTAIGASAEAWPALLRETRSLAASPALGRAWGNYPTFA